MYAAGTAAIIDKSRDGAGNRPGFAALSLPYTTAGVLDTCSYPASASFDLGGVAGTYMAFSIKRPAIATKSFATISSCLSATIWSTKRSSPPSSTG